MPRPFALAALATLVFLFLGTANAGSSNNHRYIPIDLGAGITERVIVDVGDNLWSISATQLDSYVNRNSTSSEIGPFWLRVIDENVERLISGDPDLIYPGEVVLIPSIND